MKIEDLEEYWIKEHGWVSFLYRLYPKLIAVAKAAKRVSSHIGNHKCHGFDAVVELEKALDDLDKQK